MLAGGNQSPRNDCTSARYSRLTQNNAGQISGQADGRSIKNAADRYGKPINIIGGPTKPFTEAFET